MDNYPRAVIIGAGVGGLATACFLAANGYKVDILEKNAQAGGRCGQIIQDGHRFDLGATLLLMPSIYRQVFSELGIDLDKDLEAAPLDPAYKLFFSDGSDFSFTHSEEKMKGQLETIEEGSYERFRQYITEGYDFFGLAKEQLLGRNFTNLRSFINYRNVKLLIRLKSHIRQTDYVKRFFRDKRLQMAFTFQNIYVGQNPYDAPAFFSMLPGAEMAEGALFPKGGMHRIVEKLSELAIDRGVGIHYRKPVSQILTNGRKATGVLLEDGSVEDADLIVGNADLPYIYRELLRDRRTTRRLNRKKYSCSAIVFHWGVSKVYPGLEHHSIFLNDPYRKGLEMIFRNKSLGDNPSFYVHAPVRSDLGAAPAGEDTLSVIVPVAHLEDQTVQDWKELKQKARESVIRRLMEAGLTDLEEHIKFEICYLPRTWEKSCNVTRGSVFGSLAHTIFQMGYFRPHNRHPKYENLYFAGGSTHPGNGVPLVLMSARLTTERILKESKN